MSETVSPSTNRRFGLQRVCRVWQVPRSTVYARRGREAKLDKTPPMKPGPRPAISDWELLAAIRADLASSPFRGEGHRKVWARLRVQRGIRVSKDRVLRILRENKLLSPHRTPKREAKAHDRRITTDAPNEMWGTDGARVFTLEDGWGWIFTAVEHFNAECMGWHVTKTGDRFAALEPLAQGVHRQFGSVAADAARGLALRMDHGPQYLSNHFQRQIAFWGIAPSFAFVAEPQTNGVVERFFRTLREQVIHGRTYRNLDEVRSAVGAFIDTYNEQWLLEKLGYKSPRQARRDYEARSTQRIA